MDIGCGMMAVRTQWTRDDLPPGLGQLRQAIERAVPLSAGRYNATVTDSAADSVTELAELAEAAGFDPAWYARNWVPQLGSLGSGNHYLVEGTDERHLGKEVWVSRTGAINAEQGTAGLIPGSMGTASYVVAGLGNRLPLNSSPRGAGRTNSRPAARRAFTHDLGRAMSGIEYRDTDAFVDEIPAAYKDIDVVMADAADLVEIRHTLPQIVNPKGD